MRTTAHLGLVLVLAGAVAAQTTIRTHVGQSYVENFGRTMSSAGDLDGDGMSEYVVGAHFAGGLAGTMGRADVFDGATGSIVYSWTGSPGDQLGYVVAGGEDVMGNGTPDVVVGVPGAGPNGELRIHDGPTGALVNTIPGPGVGGNFGFVLLLVDVDQNGVFEILLTMPGLNTSFAFTGSGALLTTFIGNPSLAGFGIFASEIGDVDGDGWIDCAFSYNNSISAPAEIRSGQTGLLIRQLTTGGLTVSGPLAGPGDVDGDGVPDVAVQTSPIVNTQAFAVLSGADSSVIWSVPADPAIHMGNAHPQRLLAVDDMNGDGVREVAVGARSSAGWLSGNIVLLSGATGERVAMVRGASSWFAQELALAGDVNGDGTLDFMQGDFNINSQPFGGPLDRVSVISGALDPTTTASAVVLGASCNSANDALLSTDSTPTLGTTVTLSLVRGAPSTAGELGIHFAWPSPGTVLGTCTLWLDLSAVPAWITTPIQTDMAGDWSTPVSLASSAPLLGLPVTLQAALYGPGPAELSNGLVAVLGN